MTGASLMRAPRGTERGFILVTVLWILAALAAFTAVYAVYVSDTASASAVRAQTLRADGLVVAAVELAALRLLSVPAQDRPISGEVRFRMGEANVSARFADEAARIDLNSAALPVLAGLFQVLGVPEQAAKTYAASIVAWRTPARGSNSVGTGSAASAGKTSVLGDDEAAKGQGAFAHAAELARVPGLPANVVAAALPYLTVYAGRREVNPELAGPVVRAALAKAGQGMDDIDNATFANTGGSSGDAKAGGDGTAIAGASGLTTVAGDTARVTVRVAFDNGRKQGAEAVILLRDFGIDPYRVLLWRDLSWRELADLDAAPAARRKTTGGRP
ncbi:general secretion pathway protein GspK [Xanthobacter sp. YC-JY1]|uniref:general secretion pathway protein GspK n=1 Tax=Xanthobacter sp. YC-JY1 TaxID=2419844 RepID=UPI001F0045A3|nr:type II secretion system protein GspK [Xanthobacter sp. YC-JY1]UJX45979.1 general secretion pathway protein GspK [Xanthobacter sp. YC-JY1]